METKPQNIYSLCLFVMKLLIFVSFTRFRVPLESFLLLVTPVMRRRTTTCSSLQISSSAAVGFIHVSVHKLCQSCPAALSLNGEIPRVEIWERRRVCCQLHCNPSITRPGLPMQSSRIGKASHSLSCLSLISESFHPTLAI